MTTFTASSELGPESAYPTDAWTLSSHSGPNLPSPLMGWDELPPPSPSLLVARWAGRVRDRLAAGYPSPPAARFQPPFRIG